MIEGETLTKALKKEDHPKDGPLDKLNNLFIRFYGHFLNTLYKKMKPALVRFLEEASSSKSVSLSGMILIENLMKFHRKRNDFNFN